ncbi:alkaline phosphatase [Acinetobacter sp. ANC 4169]|uniref:choice-of-anchor I family protein n=1 Tax=Acinetobacter sp. ANC 4169 TaxID=1977879 RepID=UPI000A331E47|nr:choice-of-anchor I family protein [Acinetobacter sp. ANC 4169]OTG72808.1 alkaline phosphatase [Acinetobacter sp. ANC 4169]
MKIQFSALMLAMLSVGLVACNDSQDQTQVTVPPVVEEITPGSIELVKIGRYESGIFGASAAEIPAYDAQSQRLFVVNAKEGVVDVLDFKQPNEPKYIQSLDAKKYLANSEVNSVAVHNGIVALAVQAQDKTQPGIVAFFKAQDLSFISQVPVGALPDMLTFSADGQKVLVANEGEPNEGYAIDPEGSVSIINVKDITKPTVKSANFQAWNSQKQSLLNAGVRIFGPATEHYADIASKGLQTTSVAQDLEPEYIAVSPDGKTAWVSLQENNAIAVLDLLKDEFVDIFPMGSKDHGLPENALDAGDRDCLVGATDSQGQLIASCAKDAGMINIKSWPGLYGMYMPDAIAHYQVNGKSYLVTANEGDAREWLKDKVQYFTGNDLTQGYAEEIRVKHLFKNTGFDLKGDYAAHLRHLVPGVSGAKLDPTVFKPCITSEATEVCADNLIKDSQIGRLTISWTQGFKRDALGQPLLENGKLVYDKLYSYGGRSFSIVDPESRQIVWDSGSEFERKIAELFPNQFNSNHEAFKFDDRSDNKGPEPEGITIGQIGKKTFAFIGLERASGIMVYDISQPQQAKFVQYFNDRDLRQTDITKQGDLGLEGLIFIAAKDSPNGQPLLVVGNEVSGSTAIYQVHLK